MKSDIETVGKLLLLTMDMEYMTIRQSEKVATIAFKQFVSTGYLNLVSVSIIDEKWVQVETACFYGRLSKILN